MTPFRFIPLVVAAGTLTASAGEIAIETKHSALVLRAETGKDPLTIHPG